MALPGTPTAAKWVSSDNFRLEVQYNNEPEWHHYRTDRHGDLIDEILVFIPEPATHVKPVIVPEQVSAYQARVQLERSGLLSSVQGLMDDPATDAEAKIAWEYATVFVRSSPFIASLAPGLGLTEQQLDQLFVDAVQVT